VRSRRGGTVILRWRDRAHGENSYAVELLVGETWFRVADLRRNARSFRHRPSPGKGTHRYRVGPVNAAGATWTEVEVDVRSRRVASDAADPLDDTPAGATALVPADLGDIPGRTLSAADIEDWFRIDLVEGVTYRFTATAAAGLHATLFDDAAGTTQIASAPPLPGGGTVLLRTAGASATRWLRVTADDPATFTRYTLSWTEE
jgi:hypothetical protein